MEKPRESYRLCGVIVHLECISCAHLPVIAYLSFLDSFLLLPLLLLSRTRARVSPVHSLSLSLSLSLPLFLSLYYLQGTRS